MSGPGTLWGLRANFHAESVGTDDSLLRWMIFIVRDGEDINDFNIETDFTPPDALKDFCNTPDRVWLYDSLLTSSNSSNDTGNRYLHNHSTRIRMKKGDWVALNVETTDEQSADVYMTIQFFISQ